MSHAEVEKRIDELLRMNDDLVLENAVLDEQVECLRVENEQLVVGKAELFGALEREREVSAQLREEISRWEALYAVGSLQEISALIRELERGADALESRLGSAYEVACVADLRAMHVGCVVRVQIAAGSWVEDTLAQVEFGMHRVNLWFSNTGSYGVPLDARANVVDPVGGVGDGRAE